MGRGRKLLIAGLVLLTGIVLAWPFRKATSTPDRESQIRQGHSGKAAFALKPVSPPLEQPAAATLVESPVPSVHARTTGLGSSLPAGEQSKGTMSFDLANHPALSGEMQTIASSAPVTPAVPPTTVSPETGSYFPGDVQRMDEARPAYETAPGSSRRSRGAHDPEIRHVVQNSDTLEKIAKRYLGDEGRALEIFDLNRDLLDNPHLLPINAELRIPKDANYQFD